MSHFPIHDAASAPEASKPVLKSVQDSMGRIPNLFGVFASSPAALKAYLNLAELQDNETAFDEAERQLLFLSISAENGCGYCVAAHSTVAAAKSVAPDVVAAARSGAPLANPKHEALRTFAMAVVRAQGRVEAKDLDALFGAGYNQRHALEVVLAVAFKTLSNFTNHMASIPVDAAFKSQSWAGKATPATA